MPLLDALRQRLRHLGFDVVRYPGLTEAQARQRHLLSRSGVAVVLDVGANTGQFAHDIRRILGFAKRIISFEPLESAYRELEAKTRSDPLWTAVQCALGDRNGRVSINVAGNSWSSSLLDMLPSHESAAPESRYVASEDVEVRTLDSLIDDLLAPGERCYLKIDTQGFEHRVLAGARQALDRVDVVQLELSLVPLYAGQLLFSEMHDLMLELGFSLVGLEPGFQAGGLGQILQVEGFFSRGRT